MIYFNKHLFEILGIYLREAIVNQNKNKPAEFDTIEKFIDILSIVMILAIQQKTLIGKQQNRI